MDRLSWVSEDLLTGEKSCIQQRGVRLYDGENKVAMKEAFSGKQRQLPLS
eukprot:m.22923 g.22923  ORF g.22923 m.22923 type:complete len:50 (+) comp28422_c0_seq3:172-321(+)